MSRAWMPLYVGDFLADTMHLNATETGIYMRLIMHCWQHGSIPRDSRKLALIGHCDTRLWHQYEKTVLQFFDVVDASTMQHRRVSTELQRYEELSNKRKGAAEQMHKNKRANAVQVHTQSQSPSPSLSKDKDSLSAPTAPESVSPPAASSEAKPRSTVVPLSSGAARVAEAAAFDRFWAVYPKRVGKLAAAKAFARAIKGGADVEAVIAGAERYASERAKEDAQFTKHPSTWLNAGCWGDNAPPEKTPEEIWVEQETERVRARYAQRRQQEQEHGSSDTGPDHPPELLSAGAGLH